MYSNISNITVLAIEDDVAVRRSISTYLEDSGCTVIEASCGREGLRLFRQHRPDIVYTDLNMPNIHGLDLIPQLRDECASTPIVVISGTGTMGDAVEAMKRGAWDFVSKPIRDFSTLDVLTSDLVRRSRKMKSDAMALAAEQSRYFGHPLGLLPGKDAACTYFNTSISSGQTPSMIVVNLDRFKAINASLGHSAGTELLRLTSERLKSIATDRHMVAHLDADEFALLSTADEAEVQDLVQNVRNLFKSSFSVDGQELYASACQGIVLSHQGAESFDEMLRRASMALCMARMKGRHSVQYYEEDFGKIARERNELEFLLRRALEQEEFIVHYQPQLHLDTGAMIGAEALVRWQKANGELVPPSEFIPLLEESGLIIPVGEHILRTACRHYMTWQTPGKQPLTISVNISIAQLKSGTLPATLVEIAGETGMDLSCLCLELTESIVVDEIEQTMLILEELRSLGVQLSIDDFGTGYSSLSYLRRMPICELKIDRSFISSLPNDQSNAILVTTIIQMAHAMNMRVVAEGVENKAQLRYLKELGCDMAQGYYFSKPMATGSFAERYRDFCSQPAN